MFYGCDQKNYEMQQIGRSRLVHIIIKVYHHFHVLIVFLFFSISHNHLSTDNNFHRYFKLPNLIQLNRV